MRAFFELSSSSEVLPRAPSPPCLPLGSSSGQSDAGYLDEEMSIELQVGAAFKVRERERERERVCDIALPSSIGNSSRVDFCGANTFYVAGMWAKMAN